MYRYCCLIPLHIDQVSSGALVMDQVELREKWEAIRQNREAAESQKRELEGQKMDCQDLLDATEAEQKSRRYNVVLL